MYRERSKENGNGRPFCPFVGDDLAEIERHQFAPINICGNSHDDLSLEEMEIVVRHMMADCVEFNIAFELAGSEAMPPRDFHVVSIDQRLPMSFTVRSRIGAEGQVTDSRIGTVPLLRLPNEHQMKPA